MLNYFKNVNKIGDFITSTSETEMEEENQFVAEDLVVDPKPSKRVSSRTCFCGYHRS